MTDLYQENLTLRPPPSWRKGEFGVATYSLRAGKERGAYSPVLLSTSSKEEWGWPPPVYTQEMGVESNQCGPKQGNKNEGF